MYELKKTYSYDDVTLVPHYSDLKSRGETDPSMFGFDLPIIMSPMDTVTTPDMIRLFVNNNLVASVHRAFKTAEEQFNYVVDSKNRSETKDEIDKIVKGTWFSVGSIWKYKEWINYLYEHGVVNFLVDMAHGDSLACIETVNYIRKLKNVNHIIAGNVATKSGFRHLQDAGANGIRIGIASGSICSTAMETGFGVPILTNIIDCLQVKDDNVWMIADGGCKYTGDIAKAIYFGADFVMCGKMLASTSLACGKLYNSKCQLIEKDPIFVDSLTDEEENELSNLESDYVSSHIVKYRGYKGMASRDARKGILSYASVEGHEGCIKYTGKTEQFILDTKLRLQASLSYGGARDWKSFRRNVKAVMRSSSGIVAADTHLDVNFDK